MKNTKIKLLFAVIFAYSLMAIHAQEEEKKSPLTLSITTDTAYYPKSDFKAGRRKTHFAPITSAFDSIEFCTTFTAEYQIGTPLGEHWLLSDANVVLSGGCELSPVSICPQLSVGFQPLPFFAVKGGGSVGLGWNYSDFEGLCKLDKEKKKYESLSPFNHPYYDFWGEATLMFDTGELIPGDWNHVVMLASFKALYSGIAGIERHDIFEWQCTKNKVAGAQYEVTGLLAYQMPLILSMTGIMYTAEGHFYGTDYGEFNKNYCGDFITHTIAPVLQFDVTEKDELFCMFAFSTRRNFETEPKEVEDEIFMKKIGSEWYFYRFALSWTHIF